MKKYMDNVGFIKIDHKNDASKIQRAEKWIKEVLDLGATIPEAMWDISATFSVAFEKVRFEIVQKQNASKKKRKKKSKGP